MLTPNRPNDSGSSSDDSVERSKPHAASRPVDENSTSTDPNSEKKQDAANLESDPTTAHSDRPDSTSNQNKPRSPDSPIVSSRSSSLVDMENDATVITDKEKGNVEIVSAFSTKELGSALVGTKLQSYELKEFVGGGGMGAVFRANDTKLERTVAVKVLARNGPNGELAKRFLNEAQSAAQLDHESIARVYNVDESGGLSYIVFEYIEGGNLRDAITENGPLTVQQTLHFAIQIADALDHASQRKIIHRDIKPSNILLARNDKIKLVDMGLARMTRLDSSDDDLTASGTTLGTFDYISPEQARDPRQADVRSDLYSLGCTMYFMLTGRPPFPDGNAFEKVHSHRTAKRPDPRKVRTEVPSELAGIIRRLMAPNPSSRFQQPAELMSALSMAAHELGLNLTSPSIERALARYAGRRRKIQATIPILVPAVLLVLIGIILELVMNRATGESQVVLPEYANQADQVLPTDDSESDENASSGLDNAATDDDVSQEDSRSSPYGSGDEQTRNPTESELEDSGQSTSSDIDETNVAGTTSPNDVGDDSETANLAESGSDDGTRTASSSDERGTEYERAMVEVLMVGTTGINASLSEQWFVSLDEAIAVAEDFPNLQTIQLCFDGEHQCDPFELDSGRWDIEAGRGYQPALRFTPDSGTEVRTLIDVIGAELTFRGIDFIWDVPIRLSSQGQSLFRIRENTLADRHNQDLHFYDCTFTVGYASAHESLIRPPLSIIEVVAPDEFEIDRGEVIEYKLPPDIRLDRCAVRGPVVLVSTPIVTPYRLDWTQGLFVSDQRLIESGGSARPPIGFAIHLTLENVFVAADRGLAKMMLSFEEPQPLPLSISSSRCVYWVDDNHSLVEHELFGPIDRLELLVLDGDDVFVDETASIWSIRDLSDRNGTFEFGLLDAIEDGRWFAHDQVLSIDDLDWDSTTTSLQQPPELRNLDDYQIGDRNSSLSGAIAGFDIMQMREFPLVARQSGPMPPRPARQDDTDDTGSMPTMPDEMPTMPDEMPPMPAPSSSSPSTNRSGFNDRPPQATQDDSASSSVDPDID